MASAPSISPNSSPKKPGSLWKSASIVGIATLLSRVLGLVRDILIANIFGAGSSADAFFIAFKLPNFLRRLFAEGAFSQAFVPVLAEYREKRTQEEVKDLVNKVATVLGAVTLIISLLSVLAAPVLVYVFAPGFTGSPEKFALTAELVRITFPYLFFISLVAFSGSILNTYGIFAPTALAPVVLNLCMIAATLFARDWFSPTILALGWSVFIAGLLQLLVQLPALHALKLSPRISFQRRHEGVSKVLRLMLPALVGVSVSQVNLLVDTILASFLVTGSVSWLYYSDRLLELPLGLFGIAIATVILPHLSRLAATNNVRQFSITLDWGIKCLLLVGVPAAASLMLITEPILISLFQYGAFDLEDVTQTSASLRAYSLGLVPIMIVKIFTPGFYARQDMKTPVRIAILVMSLNMVFNLILVWPLKHVGLALATSISGFLQVFLLYRALKKHGGYETVSKWPGFLIRIFIATTTMCGLLYAFNPSLNEWMAFDLTNRLWRLSVMLIGAVAVYPIVLFLAGMRLKDLKSPPAELTST
ncbi:MAG: murein biosynthesis integral membrane protein MurJ [Pseudomonadota bacterium]